MPTFTLEIDSEWTLAAVANGTETITVPAGTAFYHAIRDDEQTPQPDYQRFEHHAGRTAISFGLTAGERLWLATRSSPARTTMDRPQETGAADEALAVANEARASVTALAPNVRKITTDAGRAPLQSDDASQGYEVGSRWLWGGQEWTAADVSAGLAVWVARPGERPGSTVFHDWQYISPVQIALIRAGNTAAQNATAVTAGLRAMHNAGMEAAKRDTDNAVVFKYSGQYAVNDELFDETFAQDLWDLPQDRTKFVFDADFAVFKAQGWPSHKTTRTSGLYKREGITTPVPSVMFRWEQKYWAATGPIIRNIVLEGEGKLTDPIGFKARKANTFRSENFEVRNFRNVGRFMESVVNSDEYGPTISSCGWQPTSIGGTGQIPAGVTFSITAGATTSTLVASEPIFDAAKHTSRWFYVADAGPNGHVFSGIITAVDNATTATLHRVCSANVSGVSGSFDAIVGGISADGVTLTLNAELADDLVGRYVCVYKAGSKLNPEFDMLVTRVVAQAGRVLTLATPAKNTVANMPVTIAFAEMFCISDDFKAHGAADGGAFNDYQIYGARNENPSYTGAGTAPLALWQRAVGVQCHGSKTHGQSYLFNNFGGGWTNTVFDSCWDVSFASHQFEWGVYSTIYGQVVVCGNQNHVTLSHVEMGRGLVADQTALFYVAPASADASLCRLVVDGYVGVSGSFPGTLQKTVKFGANGRSDHLISSGPFMVRNSTANFTFPTKMMDVDISGSLSAAGLPVYADNAAALAAGLANGRLYRTATGEVRAVVP